MSIQDLKTLAREHWTKHLPNQVKALNKQGQLEQELQAAASRAQTEIDRLMRMGYQEHEAREVALLQLVILKPATLDTDEDDLDREVALTHLSATWSTDRS